ncbi:MAG: DnaJ domain-containing protein, partial [Gammaproteobacteria bacterium]
LALIALPVLAYFLVKELNKRFNLTTTQNRVLFVILAAFLLISVLVIMGRVPVHFILAPIGAAAAFMLRMLPTLLRLLPMWQLFKSRTAGAGSRSQNQSSTIRTDFLEMELRHSSGDMDGMVLKGSFAQQKLSGLSPEQLLRLRDECRTDGDSLQVLEAYLDRMHAQWRDQARQDDSPPPQSDDIMTKTLALEILGLEEGADKELIIKAHRALMQKLHPDRGGSDYLAKKINAAKDFLLDQL